ncbi:MAG TPA: response regulator [Bryobacteraceae bacterium]|nr:response regulator [Bryobacteraceae bacterium]
MPEPTALEALFPSPRRVVLCAMFHEPNRWWSLPELAGRAGVQPASLRQHMAALREGGVIREKMEGGRAWFQADPGCPVFAEIQSLVGKLSPRDGHAETILVVEDQPATAQITRILLESWGYCVIEAHSGDEALALFEGHAERVHLVLTDLIMPGLTGTQLAAELTRRKPGLRIVFMSGYPNDSLTGPDVAFLPKPFNPASLSRMIRRELDRPTPAVQPARHMKSS